VDRLHHLTVASGLLSVDKIFLFAFAASGIGFRNAATFRVEAQESRNGGWIFCPPPPRFTDLLLLLHRHDLARSNHHTTHKAMTDNNTADWQIQRDTAKAAADAAFRAGDYATAVTHYSAALSLDPTNGTLLSNRSAAHLLDGSKSKALHDAQACVATGTMGLKGISRLAAALQALGRFEAALEQWRAILKEDETHAAACAGKEACEKVVAEAQEKAKEEEEKQKAEEEKDDDDDDDDDLGDFFDEVEEAAETVVQQKLAEAQPVATEAIKNHKKDLGTAAEQIERLLPDNYQWHNLNPFHVLDISHTASAEDIARRYKALSLLLHPDKNRNLPKAQDAYDQVLAAKAVLYDEDKAKHVRQLVEQGMQRGQHEYEKSSSTDSSNNNKKSLSEYQRIAVQRLFAEIEHTRRQVEKRERAFQQREQQQEDQVAEQEKQERKFDKNWRQEERVDKRIGNWRDFSQTKKKKKA